MLCHVWMMKLRDGVGEEKLAALVSAMADLTDKIEEIRSFRSGRDLGLGRGNADVALVAEFDDVASWKRYLAAPAHSRFVTDHVDPLSDSWWAIQITPGADTW